MSLVSFQFDDFSVRTIDESGQTWFVAADVCAALGLDNVSLAVNGRSDRPEDGLDDDEKGIANVYTLGGEQKMLTVNESGLHALVFKSRRAEAKRFRKWVTSEVLPAIRKTGSYGAITAPANPYQLTAEDLEQVKILGRVAAAFMAEISPMLHTNYSEAREQGVSHAAANKLAIAVANNRLKELENFRKERENSKVRAQKNTDKAIAAVSDRLKILLEKESLTVDEYLEKIEYAQARLTSSGQKLLLT